MAKANIIKELVRFDRSHETKLVIYENKKGHRASLHDSYGRFISSTKINEQDTDKAIAQAMSVYGFTDENCY